MWPDLQFSADLVTFTEVIHNGKFYFLCIDIQAYPCPIQTYSAILWYITLAYSELCHIQNSGIIRTQDIFRTLSRHILVYSKHCVTLAYWEPCHIQNFGNLGPEAYSESSLFRYIQAYSGIFNNDFYNNINFLFFTLILNTFQQNLKMFFDYNDVNFITRLSVLNMRSLKRALK